MTQLKMPILLVGVDLGASGLLALRECKGV